MLRYDNKYLQHYFLLFLFHYKLERHVSRLSNCQAMSKNVEQCRLMSNNVEHFFFIIIFLIIQKARRTISEDVEKCVVQCRTVSKIYEFHVRKMD